ncbi:hypothetical protein MMC19_007024 [Ptychographa xylographoides]|nr:hypothetical protein [Ptychographa xylographoides]
MTDRGTLMGLVGHLSLDELQAGQSSLQHDAIPLPGPAAISDDSATCSVHHNGSETESSSRGDQSIGISIYRPVGLPRCSPVTVPGFVDPWVVSSPSEERNLVSPASSWVDTEGSVYAGPEDSVLLFPFGTPTGVRHLSIPYLDLGPPAMPVPRLPLFNIHEGRIEIVVAPWRNRVALPAASFGQMDQSFDNTGMDGSWMRTLDKHGKPQFIKISSIRRINYCKTEEPTRSPDTSPGAAGFDPNSPLFLPSLRKATADSVRQDSVLPLARFFQLPVLVPEEVTCEQNAARPVACSPPKALRILRQPPPLEREDDTLSEFSGHKRLEQVRETVKDRAYHVSFLDKAESSVARLPETIVDRPQGSVFVPKDSRRHGMIFDHGVQIPGLEILQVQEARVGAIEGAVRASLEVTDGVAHTEIQHALTLAKLESRAGSPAISSPLCRWVHPEYWYEYDAGVVEEMSALFPTEFAEPRPTSENITGASVVKALEHSVKHSVWNIHARPKSFAVKESGPLACDLMEEIAQGVRGTVVGPVMQWKLPRRVPDPFGSARPSNPSPTRALRNFCKSDSWCGHTITTACDIIFLRTSTSRSEFEPM